jgi:hypothetical protein
MLWWVPRDVREMGCLGVPLRSLASDQREPVARRVGETQQVLAALGAPLEFDALFGHPVFELLEA